MGTLLGRENHDTPTSPWIQRAVPSKYEISIFNKLGESMKGTAPNARRLQTESRWSTYLWTTKQ
ncbi:hypothetical protein [Aquiflexum gelatinilyticum]|uniref:Uncharacterized protein n=1 Tax=Aquiflexum gelatinilyticum TaxID=2961943 RepID=A0A9X2P274_9BACT|nr:hypothetical protein [Aquiflexum gelatinilyticum]MCR9014454.1 hypothetical protein [Aquiflexum gelatinilyticum]